MGHEAQRKETHRYDCCNHTSRGVPGQVRHRQTWRKTATTNAPSHSHNVPVKRAHWLHQQREASGVGVGGYNPYRVSFNSELFHLVTQKHCFLSPRSPSLPHTPCVSPVISAAGPATPWASVLLGTGLGVVAWGLLGREASWGWARAGLGRSGGVETAGGLWSRSSGGGTGTATGGELHASLFTRSTSMGPLTLFR